MPSPLYNDMNKQSNSAYLTVERLKEISNWVSSVLDLDHLLELIIDTATRMVQAKASSLLLLDKKTNKLYFKVAIGESQEEVRKFEIDMGQGIAGLVAKEGEPLLIPDVTNDPRWYKQISESTGFQTRSIACVPMKVGSETIGVVEVIDKEDGSTIQKEDMNLLTVFAELASLAIGNAQKIDQVQKENRDLKEELWKNFEIIGESEILHKVLSDGLKVANSKTSTLILGESGTGKELLARLIHNVGPRKEKPMIILNCAALPETLLEAALLQGPLLERSESLNSRIRGLCFWTKSERCRPICRRNFLASCRKGFSTGWGAAAPSQWTCE
jgi:Nif-specific regulatory protein